MKIRNMVIAHEASVFYFVEIFSAELFYRSCDEEEVIPEELYTHTLRVWTLITQDWMALRPLFL